MKSVKHELKSNMLRRSITMFWTAITLISLTVMPSYAGAKTKVKSETPAITTSIAQPITNGPLSIADAVQFTRKNSPMILAAGDQVSAAQARIGMARAMTRPQLAATAFGGTSTMGDIIASPSNIMPSSLFTIPNRSGITGQASLMLPIYTGGRLSGAIQGAEALTAAAASDSASIEQNAVLETKTAYHRTLLAQSVIEVYNNLVTEQRERVRIAEVAYEEGKIAKYDLLRNNTGLAEAEQQLANAERDAQVALVDLRTMMGVNPESNITLSDKLAYSQVPGTSDSYLATALKNRPEIAAIKARIESANVGVAIAKSAFKPQVYGNAMGGLSTTSDGTDTGLTIGIVVGLPILDGGLRRSAVKEAESMREVMRRDEQQAVLAVQRDVNTVWAELQAANRNVQLSETAVTQAEEDYRVIRLRYESGKAINVEVLDALASLVRAQNNRIMSLYEHNVARDRLVRAIGEL
ncbi:MAG: TolC family protein [Armatimonadota bacterium]